MYATTSSVQPSNAHERELQPRPEAGALASIKAKQQATWATGDYARVGNLLVMMGELLCEAADLRPGARVLDIATGSGNTALSAARRFCTVTGIDYVPALLDGARERAAAEGLEVTFLEGDAEALAFPDASFDAVLSTLGVMFAPDQERAAAEMLRVCRPGGTIGLTCWTPEGFIGRLFGVVGRYAPPPPGLKPASRWGTEAGLRELSGAGAAIRSLERKMWPFRYPSARFYQEYFRAWYGPTSRAFAGLGPADQERLATDIEALVAEFNRSGDETMLVPSEYLEVVAVRA